VKLPRDVSGRELAKALTVLGYRVTRETGSHMRLTTLLGGEHHLTVPDPRSFGLARYPRFWQESVGTMLGTV
jgi:predicted RNA binding protein YcfA (HicA-like mRNA interferase family)